MRQSKLFTKTLKEAPKDEESINAKFLVRAGFIDKLMSGVYTFLPMGLRVLDKIKNIIREEMDAIGGQEIYMPSLQPRKLWNITGRWDEEVMFKTKSQAEKIYGLGWTHEEVVTPLIKKFCNSYKDLPVYVYQIQNKFRDEMRSKSGLLRSIEFSMKDLYSFHKDEKDLEEYYEKVKDAYFKILDRCDLKGKTYLTFASGGAFSKYSHEFQTVTDFGEDIIYLCKKCNLAINKEIFDGKCVKCGNKDLEEKKAIEVANIFKLKTKFSEAFNYKYIDKDGEKRPVIMGCYGLGPSRLMGTIVEIFHDNKGIIWPESVAPYKVHLLCLRSDDKKVAKIAENLYNTLQKNNIDVLYDDRNESPGIKLNDADLIGIPIRLIVSEKTVKEDSCEFKKRERNKIELVKLNSIIKKVSSALQN